MSEQLDTLETYRPTPKQNLFHADPARYRLLMGAYGSGKTTMLNWEAIITAMEYPGCLGVIYRKTYPALSDTTQRDFFETCPAELIAHRIRSEGREEVLFPNGSRILFRCLDDWRKLGSTRPDFIAIDEAWEIDVDTFRTLIGRLRGKVGPRRMWLATNPPNVTHWLHSYFVTDIPTPGAWTVHKYSTYDNAENLPAHYIEQLETYPESWRRRFLEGEWGFLAEGTPVYPEFRESTHVGDLTPVSGLPILRGWDPGFSRAVCLFGQRLPSGHCIILDELLGEQLDVDVFVRRVQEKSAQRFPGFAFEDYCDIAGTQRQNVRITAVQVMRANGVFPRVRRLDLQRSILSLRYLIGRLHQGTPLLRVNRCARHVIEMFAGGYVMDERKDDSGQLRPAHGEETPKKDGFYDHFADAARYMLAGVSMPTPSHDRVISFQPRVAV